MSEERDGAIHLVNKMKESNKKKYENAKEIIEKLAKIESELEDSKDSLKATTICKKKMKESLLECKDEDVKVTNMFFRGLKCKWPLFIPT